MSYEQPTKEWTEEDIDLMVELLSDIEQPGFVAFTWPPSPSAQPDQDGVPVYSLASPIYHSIVDKLSTLTARTSCYLEPDNELPEDPDPESVPFDALSVDLPAEYFATATLNQIRRYLVLIIRGERFCDGCIASQFATRSIHDALHRLRELRAEMSLR